MLPLDLDGFLQELKSLPLVNADEAHGASRQLQKKLTALYDDIKKDPAALSEQTLAALERTALSSPYSDINDPDAEIHHEQTPAQDVCLQAVRIFNSLAFTFPQKSGDIVQRLENIAQNSLDYDMRHEAVMTLWDLSEKKYPCASYAVAALERQGEQNSNAYIRILARDNLLMTSHDREDIIPRAMAAQIKGTEDADPGARARALAMLINRGVSPSCPAEEAKSLLSVFEKAAADTRSTDALVADCIKEGMAEIKTRLKEGPAPYKFP